MKLPATGRKRALIVVDVQPAFVRPHNQHIIQNIQTLLSNVPYDAYVETVFSAEKDSLWDIQQQWTCPEDENTHTVTELQDLLADKHALKVRKTTRSSFNGTQDLVSYFNDNGIEEVHIVGLETNDCVLATAFDAFDADFPVYVLEECCESATEGRHQMGVDILRLQGMTNNRCLAETEDITL